MLTCHVFRYGLDFRLLSRRRLAILDATQVLERAQTPIQPTSNNSSVLTPIPHIEAITAQLVSERRPGPLISLTKGVLVSFEENGAGIENVGVRFVELVIKALSAGASV